MADDRYWVGGTDGDWDVNGNWKQADLVSASATPVDGDSVYFTTGSVDVDTNLAVDDIALVNFVVTDGYTGNLGLTGTHLEIDVTNFTYDGGGVAFIDLKSDTDATATVVTVIGTGSGTLNLGTDTNGTISSGTYLGGTINIADATAHTADTDLLISQTNPADIPGLTVTIGTSVTNLRNITKLGGTLTIASEFVLLTQTGGTTTHTAGTLTTALAYGGTFNAESADTVTNIKAYGNAVVDGSGSEIARTWTNVELFSADAHINIANGRGNITLTNDIITFIKGRLPITVDEGSTVAIS